MRVKCLAQDQNAVPWPGLEPGPFDPELLGHQITWRKKPLSKDKNQQQTQPTIISDGLSRNSDSAAILVGGLQLFPLAPTQEKLSHNNSLNS